MPNSILHCGDALEVLERLSDNSIEALVTDPPAGIGFMGKKWDSDRGGRDQWIAWLTAIMLQVYRVLKPGAHGLVWALPRTSHWTATALEDAGFEIRDVVMHLFGQGFPKSLDVSKAIDREAGARRPIIGKDPAYRPNAYDWVGGAGGKTPMRPKHKTGPATPAAREWSGWGTALKPAAEHWILIRKPLGEKTVAKNVRRHRTGALNVDASRVAGTKRTPGYRSSAKHEFKPTSYGMKGHTEVDVAQGRFPAHLILDDTAGELLDAQTGLLKSGKLEPHHKDVRNQRHCFGAFTGRAIRPEGYGGDVGGASRFFYCAKASTRERGAGNRHPTVKPIALMRYLIRLITPPGGTVLDPFAGSGTTGVAAKLERMKFIGVERDRGSVRTARRRLRATASDSPTFASACLSILALQIGGIL